MSGGDEMQQASCDSFSLFLPQRRVCISQFLESRIRNQKYFHESSLENSRALQGGGKLMVIPQNYGV